ncbi:MAG: serine hydrolase [Pyrinomonadaceae bacterium]
MRKIFAVAFAAMLFLGLHNLSFAQPKPKKIKQSSASSKANAEREQLIARLEKVIPQVMKDGDVPGLSIAFIRNGEVLWHRGFGVKNADTKEPVTDDTVFEAASLSKPVFAYAVMKMVESGKLDLDAPLTKYFSVSDVEKDDRLSQITTRRVLSHTTGFPNVRTGGKSLQIYFTPDKKFSYSTEGINYLQIIIEHISGQTLEEFMRKTVFEPLGMTSSSYIWQDKYESVKAFSHDSTRAVTGRVKHQPRAATSLHTTALDYARFVAAILNRKGIKEATVREMLRPQIKVEEDCVICYERTTVGRFSPSISWGLGWGLQRADNKNFIWHWGDISNWRSYVVADDKLKTGVIIFTNSANGLSIVDEIMSQAGIGKQPALAWMGYEPYNTPSRVLLRDILASGEKAISEYRERRNTSGKLDESQTIWVGYQLLGKKRFNESIEVFKIVTETYPNSSKAYDVLGEAYLKSGDYGLAVKNYQRAAALNPQNTNAATVLKQLQSSQIQVDAKILEAYAGDYETPFGVLTIVKEGDRLLGRLSGEPEMVLLPQSETQFIVAIAGIPHTFVRDEKGQVTYIVIKVNGKEFQAKRIR